MYSQGKHSITEKSQLVIADALGLTPMDNSERSDMPEYIDADVRKLRDSDGDAKITLLLGVSGDRDEFASRVKQVGATVKATLGRATLRVSAPQSVVDDLCKLDGLKSIEIERDDVRTLDEGNGRSPRRVTRS